MSNVTFGQSISLDGFSAGPDQSLENPLGIGGEELHTWALRLEEWRKPHGLEGGDINASSAVLADSTSNIGAYVMGRNMFGGGPGPWADDPWQGWWGDNPPFHKPVFVVTHHPRPPWQKEGGTMFHFVSEGFDRAFEQAQAASAGAGVSIAGGASTIQQALRSGVVDEFWMHVVPVVLGSGTRFFDNLGDVKFEQIQSVAGDGVVHSKYRVVK